MDEVELVLETNDMRSVALPILERNGNTKSEYLSRQVDPKQP